MIILAVVDFYLGAGLFCHFRTHGVCGNTGTVQFPADSVCEFMPDGDVFVRGERMTVCLSLGSILGISVLQRGISWLPRRQSLRCVSIRVRGSAGSFSSASLFPCHSGWVG